MAYQYKNKVYFLLSLVYNPSIMTVMEFLKPYSVPFLLPKEMMERSKDPNSIFREIFDPGIRRRVEFGKRVAPPVDIFTRKTFIHIVRCKVREGYSLKRGVLMFDIERLGGAARVKDSMGRSLADYVLNRVADSLKGLDLDVARYAGDEFLVLCSSNCNDEFGEKIRDSLLAIKDDDIPWLKHGVKLKEMLFLNERQLAQLLNRRTISNFTDTEAIDEDNLVDFKIRRMEEADRRLERLIKEHPELRRFSEIRMFEKGELTDEREIEEIMWFVEEVVFHPLFEDIVYSLPHFKELMRDNYQQIISFHTSFLKEINDAFGLEEGDAFLKAYMSKVSGFLGMLGASREDFILTVRGGLILAALRKRVETSQNISLGFEFRSIQFPIGMFSSPIESLPNSPEELNRFLGRVIGGSEKNWAGKVISKVGGKNNLSKLQLQVLKKPMIEGKPLDFQKLLQLYFSNPQRGCRRKELFK